MSTFLSRIDDASNLAMQCKTLTERMPASPAFQQKFAYDVGISLLAFVIAFFAFVVRERKTPYSTNSVFKSVLLTLSAIFFATASILTENLSSRFSILRIVVAPAFYISCCLLLIAILVIIAQLYRLYCRHHYFSDAILKNLWPIRIGKKFCHFVASQWPTRGGRPYEQTSAKLTEQLKTEIERSMPGSKEKLGSGSSLAVALVVDSLGLSDDRTVPLGIAFLENRQAVQYTSCVRHPFEYIQKMNTAWDSGNSLASGNEQRTFGAACRSLAVVDAYTPHFGFKDSVHASKTREMKDTLKISHSHSANTYAGVHTAAGDAFKAVKSNFKESERPVTLVIYEGLHALVDLESREQYHVFLRHVIPSERMWGGMITVFVECGLPDEELQILRSYTDIFIDLRTEHTNRSGGGLVPAHAPSLAKATEQHSSVLLENPQLPTNGRQSKDQLQSSNKGNSNKSKKPSRSSNR